MAYNVDALGAYVAENKDIILKDIVFGGEYGNTVPLMAKELGVKGTAKIHPATISAVLQEVNGECGFHAEGDLNITDVQIVTKQYKVNTEFCAEKLIGKFAEYKVRVGANEDALPFEAEIVEGLVKDINRQIESGVWEQLAAVEGVKQKTFSNPDASVYDKVMEVYMEMDEAILEDGIIFLSPSYFRSYVKDLVDKNLYHYNPADGALDEIFIPGASVKVRKANGITGGNANKIWATSAKNMVYATDFMGNAEEVKVWYSDDADAYRVKVRFNYGAAFIFPNLVVRGEN
ncbi:MAG: hypothetical protein UD103_05935 [Bacteroidales bacterium]|nr:hypothetical protein [Bacteroidales bacterium]